MIANYPSPSLRANGSREYVPDDRLSEAIHAAEKEEWIASSLSLLAMTPWRLQPQIRFPYVGIALDLA